MTTQKIPDNLLTRLSHLQGRRTLYEAVLTDGTDTYLLGYCGTYSTRGLRDLLYKRVSEIAQIVGCEMEDMSANDTKNKLDPILVGKYDDEPNWKYTVKFTGRTQRECLTLGAWPFVCSVVDGRE